MINLVVDIGNTFSKVAVFDHNQKVMVSKFNNLTPLDLEQLVKKYAVNNLMISSVNNKTLDFEDEDWLKNINLIYFNHQIQTPIKNNYQTPQTLGLDRLAAMVGAFFLYPNQSVLAIDAGTCITYDFLNKQSVYKGGSISPGIQMRFKAMHHFTGKLPEVAFDANASFFYGSNTLDAIQSGVINGVFFEVAGYIQQYLNEDPQTKIILCGGDASFFDTRLKNSIFAHQILLEPDLVLIGLNTIVNYQHDQN